VHNGLLLSALWDAAFDGGLVSFADDGTALAGSALSPAGRAALGIERAPRLANLRDAHRANLAAHRARHGFSDISSRVEDGLAERGERFQNQSQAHQCSK
jgi:hypothetical protein